MGRQRPENLRSASNTHIFVTPRVNKKNWLLTLTSLFRTVRLKHSDSSSSLKMAHKTHLFMNYFYTKLFSQPCLSPPNTPLPIWSILKALAFPPMHLLHNNEVCLLTRFHHCYCPSIHAPPSQQWSLHFNQFSHQLLPLHPRTVSKWQMTPGAKWQTSRNNAEFHNKMMMKQMMTKMIDDHHHTALSWSGN